MTKMAIFIGAVLYPAHGKWVELPTTTDELDEAIAYARTEDCEEVMISDYEGIKCEEYDNIYDINERAEMLSDLDDDEAEIFEAVLDDVGDFDEALRIVEDHDYLYYSGCCTMEEVARMYCEDTGLLAEIPVYLRDYFDFEAYGRNMEMSGNFIELSDGFVEIFR